MQNTNLFLQSNQRTKSHVGAGWGQDCILVSPFYLISSLWLHSIHSVWFFLFFFLIWGKNHQQFISFFNSAENISKASLYQAEIKDTDTSQRDKGGGGISSSYKIFTETPVQSHWDGNKLGMLWSGNTVKTSVNKKNHLLPILLLHLLISVSSQFCFKLFLKKSVIRLNHIVLI